MASLASEERQVLPQSYIYCSLDIRVSGKLSRFISDNIKVRILGCFSRNMLCLDSSEQIVTCTAKNINMILEGTATCRLHR
jgi:hypothetical protein